MLGTALGLVTGYFRGAVDDVLARHRRVPGAARDHRRPARIVALGPSKLTLILVIGVLFAPIIARTVRAAVLTERELDYVAAARCATSARPTSCSARSCRTSWDPVMVEFTVRLGYAIFTIATLTFLGFGIQPPAPDWGLQVFEHYGLISGGFWWTVLFPALAITSLVVGVNLIADGVAKAFGR